MFRPRVEQPCVFLLSVLLLSWLALSVACVYRGTAQRAVRDEPVRFVDASTGKPIQEVLVIPHYSSFDGLAVAPEGPAHGNRRDYLAAPFVYLAGQTFRPNQPKSTGVFWGPLYTGKAISLEGVVVFAPGYQRKSFNDFWPTLSPERRLGLTPISAQASSRELLTALNSLQKNKLETAEEVSFWNLSNSTSLEIKLTATERELVRSFIQRALQNLGSSSLTRAS